MLPLDNGGVAVVVVWPATVMARNAAAARAVDLYMMMVFVASDNSVKLSQTQLELACGIARDWRLYLNSAREVVIRFSLYEFDPQVRQSAFRTNHSAEKYTR